MIKVFYGKKGTGKTKNMLENANGIVAGSAGNVVYIDDSNELLIKLRHSNLSSFSRVNPPEKAKNLHHVKTGSDRKGKI